MKLRRGQWVVFILLACAAAAFFGLRGQPEEPRPALVTGPRQEARAEPSAREARSRAPAQAHSNLAGSTPGVVRARAGEGLEGATVCVAKPAGDPGSFERCVETDEGGRFEFAEGLEPATSVLASAVGYRSRLQQLERDATPNEELLIELDPGGDALSGQVVDASGGAVIGALVTLRGASDAVIGAASSDADGRFEITASMDGVELCARAEAYSRTCRLAADSSEEHVLVLAPESVITGRVLTRASETAVAGASVIASNRNGLHVPPRSTVSAEDGSFAISGLPAGGYALIAVAPDSRSVEQWVSVGLGETSAPVTLWAAPAVRLSAVVLSGGEPCARGSVALSGPVWVHQSLLPDGTVQLDGLLPGRYDATADCDHALSQTASLAIASEPVEHVWELEKLPGSWEPNEAALANAPAGGTLRAVIEGELSGISGLFVESQEGALRRGRRRDSVFVFEGLLAGEYRVYVNDVEQAERARITRDGEVVEMRLRASPPAWITGRVLSDDGVPVPDAWVSATRSDAAVAALMAAPPTLTDQNGAFSLAGVPGALYALRVASPSGDARLERVKVDQDVLIRVFPPASLSGQVLTAEGQPVPEFTLTYQSAHDGTVHEGRGAHSFHLPMLEPGAYSLTVSSPLGSARKEVQLAPRESSEVTLTVIASEG